ncbi:MAG: hypothetical protein M0R17_05535 [Candidatus Omnitrophica bacterium]|jgi:hypothetical protein|nr:hypothetical protein [Candidatus Omnitrophota bacterium]
MDYSPDDQNRYYDPQQNTKSDVDVGTLARQIVLPMVADVAGLLVAKYVTHTSISKLKSWRTSQNSFKNSLSNSIFSKTESFNKKIQPFKKSITENPLYKSVVKSGQEREALLSNLKGTSRYNTTRVSSVFKNPKTLAYSAAKVWKENVWSGMAAQYAIDHMLGVNEQWGLEKKSVYDIPGQAVNFGKWLGASTVFGLGFGGAGPLVKAMGSTGLKATQKVFGGEFGKKVLDTLSMRPLGVPKDYKYTSSSDISVFNKHVISDLRSNEQQKFAANAVRNKLSFGSNVGEAFRNVQNSLYVASDTFKGGWQSSGVNVGSRTRQALGVLETSLKNVREILIKPREKLTSTISHPGIQAINFLTEISKNKNTKIDTGSTEFANFMTQVSKDSYKETAVGRIFKFLKPLQNKDVVSNEWIKNTYGNLSDRFADTSTAKTLMRNVLNMRVGQNIYRDWRGSNIKGAGVDLGAFDPILSMRRTASKILNHQFNLPLTKLGMSLGDITGINTYLSEAPSFEFFKQPPEFKYKNHGSIGDLADNKSNAMFAYNNGKWAVINNNTVRIVDDSGHRLRYASKSGKDKAFELKTIGVNRMRDALNKEDPLTAALRYNQIKERVDYQDAPTNPFLHYLDRRNIGLPTKLKEYAQIITDKFQDKEVYKQYVSDFFTAPSILNARALPIIGNIYERTSQTFSRVLQNKNAHQIIAHYVHNKELKDDFAGIAYSDQKMIDILDRSEFKADRHIFDNDFHRSVKELRAYPQKAKDHASTKRLGPFSDMTSSDVVRKDLIEDIFNRDFIGAPAGHAHPLIGAADDLFTARIINDKERKYLKLHAKLSVFKDEGLIKGSDHHADYWPSIVKNINDRSKKNNWDILNEITDFISNEDIRRPSIRLSQNQIIPKDWGNLSDAKLFPKDINPYTSIPDNGIVIFKDIITKSTDSVTTMMGEWLPYKKRYLQHHGFTGSAKYIGGILGTSAAVFGAYRITDTLVATNPLFDDTLLGDGLTGAGADAIARVRMGVSRVSDLTGITATMKYLHGLMPLSESSIPGAVVGGIFSKIMQTGPLGTAKNIFAGAIINRIVSPYLPDMTKTHKELTEIYSGRQQVPIMKAPTWLLGSTPWEGSKVAGYSPNWYVRAKSRWKESDNMYGSAFRKLIHEPLPFLGFNVGDIVDPYFLERKSYWSRPFPVTGKPFEEVPVIGGILANTIGRIIKPQKTMHQEFLQERFASADDSNNPYPFSIRPPTVSEGMEIMKTSSKMKSLGGRTFNGGNVKQVNPDWGETAAEDFLYDIQNFTGLKGFLSSTITDRIFGKNTVTPTFETAGRIASFSRSYSDLNLGGIGMISEGMRRIIEKPKYRQYGINPIPNMMPEYLGPEFITGDPWSSIQRGELRLPGESYLRTHPDVKRSMPARSSLIGGNIEHIVQYFTGLLPPLLKEEYDIMETGTEFHRSIQDSLAAEGLLIQAESLVHDVKNDITGHVDAIIRDGTGGGGRRALEIKTISNEGFEKLNAPKGSHLTQLNFYLRQLKMRKGTLLYVNRDNPSQVRTFEINYSQSRWEKDLAKLKKARSVAATMMQEGVGDDFGYSYSWLDRLNILSDVSPMSPEYKEAKMIVDSQIKFGMLNDKELLKYKNSIKMRQARIRKYELYEKRFAGKLFNPDTELNIQSINDDIKAGANYSLPERSLGWLYEQFTNTNTFLVNKFWAVKDPLEHYKMSRIYGKEYKPWDEPIRSWAKPMLNSLLEKTNPVEGTISAGSLGYLFGGGPLGGLIGSAVGFGYGSINGIYRTLTNSAFIPEDVKTRREINSYFDAAKYERNNMMASLSSGLTQQEYLKEQNATLTAFNNNKGSVVANLFRGASVFEKPYIESFLNTKDKKERENILKYIPEDLAMALKKQWSQNDSKEATGEYVKLSSAELTKGAPKYKFSKQIMDPAVNLEDIELKTINQEGLDKFEFGLGWNEQMLRIQQSNRSIQAETISRLNPETQSLGPNISSANIRGLINNYFSSNNIKSSTNVYIDNTQEEYNQLEVVIRRDRSRTVINALNNRKKYGLSNE